MKFSINVDYAEVYECETCKNGYIAKTKENTPGFRFWNDYLCRFCLLDSKKGKLIYHEFGDDFLPKQFNAGVQQCRSKEEFKIWNEIWFKQYYTI